MNLRDLARGLRAVEPVWWSSLEELFTAPWGFGVPATPIQRAIARIVEGLPIEGCGYELLNALGGRMPAHRPKEFVLLAGIRGGKSMLAAAMAIHASQRCDLSGLQAGEVPRYSIVSLSLDLARVTFGHLSGTILRSPRLRRLLAKDPTADTVTLKHPSGRPVEVRVVAGARAGASLSARWSIGVCFDEAPKMLGGDEGVVNLDDARANVVGRLLPGAQITDVGSPWAPFGPVYDLVQEHWGKPSERVCVVRATGPQLNPAWWTPERVADVEKNDPEAYQTDVLAQFRAPESALFDDETLKAATRRSPRELEPHPRSSYLATIDPATRRNAWTLVVTTREGLRRRVVLTRQWVPRAGEPLKPREVLGEIAALLRPYRVAQLHSDQWGADFLAELARDFGLTVYTESVTDRVRTERFLAFRRDVVDGRFELSGDPDVAEDLKRVKRVATANGATIRLPITADGRHCDYAPPLVQAHALWVDDVVAEKLTGAQAEAAALARDEERVAKANRGEEQDGDDDD